MNNTMVREIGGAKINPKSSFKNKGGKIGGGGNYASKYGTSNIVHHLHQDVNYCFVGLSLLPRGTFGVTEGRINNPGEICVMGMADRKNASYLFSNNLH